MLSMVFTYAANNPIASYESLRYNALRITLLQGGDAHIERTLDPTVSGKLLCEKHLYLGKGRIEYSN